MPSIAIGTAQFGLNYGVANKTGKIAPADVREILNIARANGSTTLDTAISYGDAESTIGNIGCASWNVVTKLPAIPSDIKNVSRWVTSEVSKSLLRLNIPTLYALLLHAPNDLLGLQRRVIADALLDLKSQGIISKLGVSIYDPCELEDLQNTKIFDIVQSPMNAFDRRLATSGWLTKLFDLGVEIHIRSAFLQGLLLMDPIERPPHFAPWSVLLAHWDTWIADTNQTRVAACITHLGSFPEVAQIVVGVDNARQIHEIFAASRQDPRCVPDIISSADESLINPIKWAHR